MLVIIQQTISEVQMTKDELKPIDTSKYKITETGQVLKMTKDEMKNRISIALKDPVLQQGFEIICKENAELKGEAAKWHKVADGDLPNNYRYVWTNVSAGYYDDDGGWRDDFGRLFGVIAWCEPKFEE